MTSDRKTPVYCNCNKLCNSKDRHEYVDTFEFGHFAVSQYDKEQYDSVCQTESAIRVNADHLVITQQNSDNCTRSMFMNCGEVNYAAISLKPIKCSFFLQELSPMEVTLLVLALTSNNRAGQKVLRKDKTGNTAPVSCSISCHSINGVYTLHTYIKDTTARDFIRSVNNLKLHHNPLNVTSIRVETGLGRLHEMGVEQMLFIAVTFPCLQTETGSVDQRYYKETREQKVLATPHFTVNACLKEI